MIPATALPFYTLGVQLELLAPVELPAYLGSTLHGGFGHALMAVSKALYGQVFAPENESGDGQIRPYLFKVDTLHKRQNKCGDTLSFDLTLLGDRTACVQDVIAALFRWQNLGLGTARASFRITRIVLKQPEERLVWFHGQQFHLPQASTLNHVLQHGEHHVGEWPANGVCLETRSPWHLKHKRELLSSAPDAAMFCQHIQRRFNTLCELYGAQLQPITQSAVTLPTLTHSNVTQGKLLRYSRKDKRRQQIDGLNGSWCYEGELSEFLPWLIVGQIIGVGNKTTFGFGHYRWSLFQSNTPHAAQSAA
jgi:hypothetical protein